jgi:CRP-like cAMP-binding protein
VLTPKDFQKQFKRLLLTRVSGMDWEDKLARIRQYLRELEARNSPEEESMELTPSIEIIPFQPGNRPLDEALNPGHGVSERIGYLSAAEDGTPPDDVWILYRIKDLYAYTAPFDRPIEVRMSAWFLPPTPDFGAPCPVPNMVNVVVSPLVVSGASYPVPALDTSTWNNFYQTTYVVPVAPADLVPRTEEQLAQGMSGYRWEDAAACLRDRTPDGEDPFTFAHLFHQKLRVDLDLVGDGQRLASESIDIEVYDTTRFGALYARLLDRLVKADTEKQAATLGIEELHEGYHPWFPVLVIGTEKANLYLHAIHDDLQQHRRNLPDPGWLLRVGLYLEFLTCLGIFEAVKDEVPDMLSPAERRAFEESPVFEEVRKRINVEAWKAVWAMRAIAPRTAGFFGAGPVSLTNLLRKQKATLAFLHAHHEDLKHAIELSGQNLNNAQETWHRVFRDAERAVLKNSLAAFPELGHLDPKNREFVLWHQKGNLRLFGLNVLPDAVTSLFGDQDGLFPSACKQYRQSMNEVARWARDRTLMDYTGDDCVPPNASLLTAYMSGNVALVSALQRRDGYAPNLEVDEKFVAAEPGVGGQFVAIAEVASQLRKVPALKPLTDREVHKLATKSRRVVFGPLDRIVIQGEKGSSLFLVESGSVEVMVRKEDGRDWTVATLEPGAVFGEFALLTGAERTATVRAVEEVTLYEISKEALQPIIEARPQLVVELSMLMASRQVERRDRMAQANEERTRGIASRIRRFILGGA